MCYDKKTCIQFDRILQKSVAVLGKTPSRGKETFNSARTNAPCSLKVSQGQAMVKVAASWGKPRKTWRTFWNT
jgi:hypothetical protein